MSEVHRVLVFRINDEHYCISVKETSEVTDVRETRTLPNSPEASLGVQELEAGSVELIDPRIAFGLGGEREGEQKGIVLDQTYSREGQRLGFVVDEVYSVEEIQRDDVDESVNGPGALGGLQFDEIDGIDELVVWIDPLDLFNEETDYVVNA